MPTRLRRKTDGTIWIMEDEPSVRRAHPDGREELVYGIRPDGQTHIVEAQIERSEKEADEDFTRITG